MSRRSGQDLSFRLHSGAGSGRAGEAVQLEQTAGREARGCEPGWEAAAPWVSGKRGAAPVLWLRRGEQLCSAGDPVAGRPSEGLFGAAGSGTGTPAACGLSGICGRGT